MKSLSRVRLFATPWTVAYQAALSIIAKSQEEEMKSQAYTAKQLNWEVRHLVNGGAGHFLLSSLLSLSMWKFISTQLTGKDLVTGHRPWWSSG